MARVDRRESPFGARAVKKYVPVMARARSDRVASSPAAFDCVQLIVVRDGSAVVFGDFGRHHINIGDVIVLAPHTLCGMEPAGAVRTTTVYIDQDYLVDMTFWKYAHYMCDRFDAKQLFASRCSESPQLLRLGEKNAEILGPWLDELSRFSIENPGPETFHRTQARLSDILDMIVPYLGSTGVQTASSRRTAHPAAPRHRTYTALRREAHRAAALMRADIAHRWTLAELSAQAHLSPSQLGRVFTAAFGKSPIAYLTMLRVERMALLLRNTDTPLGTIAKEVGWRDADFAARQFRRAIGTPPSQYRATIATRAGKRRAG